MSSTTAGVRSKRRGWEVFTGRTAAIGSAKELLAYLVGKPLVAVAVLWIICLPAMYFALYGDLVESAWTLGQMTVVFVFYTALAVVFTLAISFAAWYALSYRTRRKWSG